METLLNDIQYQHEGAPLAFAISADEDAHLPPVADDGYDDEDARLLVLYAGMPGPTEWN